MKRPIKKRSIKAPLLKTFNCTLRNNVTGIIFNVPIMAKDFADLNKFVTERYFNTIILKY